MIIATKNGIIRNFSEAQWGNMPRDKFGWTIASETNVITVDPDIIKKKIVGKVVTVVEKVVPDEIVVQGKTNDLPEIKRKQVS